MKPVFKRDKSVIGEGHPECHRDFCPTCNDCLGEYLPDTEWECSCGKWERTEEYTEEIIKTLKRSNCCKEFLEVMHIGAKCSKCGKRQESECNQVIIKNFEYKINRNKQ